MPYRCPSSVGDLYYPPARLCASWADIDKISIRMLTIEYVQCLLTRLKLAFCIKRSFHFFGSSTPMLASKSYTVMSERLRSRSTSMHKSGFAVCLAFSLALSFFCDSEPETFGTKVSPSGLHTTLMFKLSMSGSFDSMSIMTMPMSAADAKLPSAMTSQNFWNSIVSWLTSRGTMMSSSTSLL